MGTAEILIVFSALMALIALVTIGIDWIGKPLKHRRFIPRIYRFEDEKLPVDAYGHAQLDAGLNQRAFTNDAAPAAYVPAAFIQPAPAPAPAAYVLDPNATVQVPEASLPAPQPAATVSSSAFTDSLSPASEQRSQIAGTSEPDSIGAAVGGNWQVGMPLDMSVEGSKPSLAIKAERFWITTAGSIGDSHFDDDNMARMAAGKAPRRMNPRSSRAEAMQLTGLRQASAHGEVRMRWPDDAADPWASS